MLGFRVVHVRGYDYTFLDDDTALFWSGRERLHLYDLNLEYIVEIINCFRKNGF